MVKPRNRSLFLAATSFFFHRAFLPVSQVLTNIQMHNTYAVGNTDT